MELRDYQIRTLDTVWETMQRQLSALIVAPCSAGKTILFSKLIQRLLRENPGFRALILVDREVLVTQAADKLRRVAPELALSIGIVCASADKTKTLDLPVTIASRQTLERQLDRFPPVQLCIVDEAHLLSIPHPDKQPDQYGSIIARLRDYNPNMRLVGCTATPYRLGSYGGYIYGEANRPDSRPYWADVTTEITTAELLEGGYIAPLIGLARTGEVLTQDLSHVGIVAGEYNLGQLSGVMCREIHVQSVVEAWRQEAMDRKKTIVFCTSKDHVTAVCAAFDKAGVRALPVHSGLSPLLLADNMQALQEGRAPVFASIAMLTTGLDVVDVDCLILARPTKSAALHKQCLDAETEILTERGWAGIDDALDCKIAQYHPESGVIDFAEGEKITRSLGDEKMYGIRSPHLDIRVTAGHRMLHCVRKRMGNGRREWTPLTFDRADGMPSEWRLPLCGTGEGRPVPLTPHELFFIGIVLTDGSVNKITKVILISQSERNPEVIRLIGESIERCGFKCGHSVNTRPSNYGERSPLHVWTISRGEPRGRDKHLSGWGRLEPWIGPDGKSMSPLLRDIPVDQLEDLLAGMFAGNGNKYEPKDYVRKTRTLSLANRALADDLQALLVRRGYRAVVSPIPDNKAVLLHYSRREFWSVRGASNDGRPTWGELPADPVERVWCVSVPSGAIVTRRNGKVAVLGNCLGRGQRLAPEKKDCLVIDLVGAFRSFGTDPDCIRGVTVPRPGGGEAPVKQCDPEKEGCGKWVHASLRYCPHCGHEFEMTEAVEAALGKLEKVHFGQNFADPESWEVRSVSYERHTSRTTGKQLVRVVYDCGSFNSRVSEWVCLPDYYEGFAVQKARDWWARRTGEPFPESIEEFFFLSDTLLQPQWITVVREGKYYKVLDAAFAEYGELPSGFPVDDSEVPF